MAAVERALVGADGISMSEERKLLASAMHVDEFRCPICLELAYKPVVNACGHVFCFWCVHRAMTPFADSRCPMCRRAFAHFPRICTLLHHLLVRAFPELSLQRQKDVQAEEDRSQLFSPEVIALEEDEKACLGEGPPAPGTPHPSAPSATPASAQDHEEVPRSALSWVRAACSCPRCTRVLFQPVVLNCGHVVCRPCVYQARSPLLGSEAGGGMGEPPGKLRALVLGVKEAREGERERAAAPGPGALEPESEGHCERQREGRSEGGSAEGALGVPVCRETGGVAVRARGTVSAESRDASPSMGEGDASSHAAPAPSHDTLAKSNREAGTAGVAYVCPRCSMAQPTGSFSVCSQLHEALERLFPEDAQQRALLLRAASGKRAASTAEEPPTEEPVGPWPEPAASSVTGSERPGTTGRNPAVGARSNTPPAQSSSGRAQECLVQSSAEAVPPNAQGPFGERRRRGSGAEFPGPAAAAPQAPPPATPGEDQAPGGRSLYSPDKENGAGVGGCGKASGGCGASASAAVAEMGAVQRAWAAIQALQVRAQLASTAAEEAEAQRQLSEARERNQIHVGVGCDCCGAFPIVGRRYRCLDCYRLFERIGFDLCSSCHEASISIGRFNQRHTPEHRLEEVQPRSEAFQHFFEANHPDTVSMIMSVLQDDMQEYGDGQMPYEGPATGSGSLAGSEEGPERIRGGGGAGTRSRGDGEEREGERPGEEGESEGEVQGNLDESGWRLSRWDAPWEDVEVTPQNGGLDEGSGNVHERATE